MQVVFEGVVGGGYLGDIALDDVTLTRHGNCSLFPSNAQSQYFRYILYSCFERIKYLKKLFVCYQMMWEANEYNGVASLNAC